MDLFLEKLRLILVFIVGCIFTLMVKTAILLLLWNNVICNLGDLPYINSIQMIAIIFVVDLLRSNFNLGNVLDFAPKWFLQMFGYEVDLIPPVEVDEDEVEDE